MSHRRWALTVGLLAGGAVCLGLVAPAPAAPPDPDQKNWVVTDHRAVPLRRPEPEATLPTRRSTPARTATKPAPPPRSATSTRPTRSPSSAPTSARPSASGQSSPSTKPSPSTRPATSGTSGTSVPSGLSAGWHSGAAGSGAVDGSFGRWRGEPLGIVGLFADTTAQVQESLPVLATVATYDGDIDIAVGGLTDDTPESWSQAAKGAYVTRWTKAARALRNARGGKPGSVYVRFAHEANADWFPWRVTASTVVDFRTSWRLFHDVLAREFPQAKLVFCANSGSRSDVAITQLWPGDEVVDVVAVDLHAGWEPTDPALWQQHLDDLTSDGDPRGLAAWLAFAASHHKPLAVSRWGLDPGTATTDDGTRVRLMHAFLSTNAAMPGRDPAGRVIYDIFFNYPAGSDTRPQITDPRNAVSAREYQSLRWRPN